MTTTDTLSLFPELDPAPAPPRFPVPSHVKPSAKLSDCGKYRWVLRRSWGAETDRTLTVVMLNPSTASADQDDPTIRRLYHFAEVLECTTFRVVNLFAFRATKPEDMLAARDPVGEHNDYWLRLACGSRADVVLCAWGVTENKTVADRAIAVGRMIADIRGHLGNADCDAYCAGTNADGSPKHPLYLANNTEVVPFNLP